MVEKDYNKPPWTKVTLEELQTPRGGKIVYEDRWWAVTDGCVLFYKGSPQCNYVRRVIERIRPDCTPTFLPVAFVEHRCDL